MENKRQSRWKGRERKREAERSNSSKDYHGRYLTRWKRTDAKRVYAFSGCRKRAAALLRDSIALQIRKSQDGSAGVSASCPGFLPFCTPLEARFDRFKSNCIAPLSTITGKPCNNRAVLPLKRYIPAPYLP